MRRLAAAAVLALAVGGCGIGKGAPDIGTGAAHDGKTKICMMPKLVGIPYFNATERGARDAARELHVELDYNGPTDATAVHQVEFIQQWVQLRCDAITVAANDPDALAPALKEARRAGVKTGSWDADVQRGARDVFTNQATFQAIGRTITDIMAHQTGGKGKFLIVTGSLTAPNQNAWIAQMRKRMKQRWPKMKIASVQPGEENLQKGIDVTKSYLSANPDTTGVFGITTVAMPGVAEAVRQLGLTGKVKVTGSTDPVIAKPYIDAGVVKQAMLWNPEDLGYLAVYVAKKMIDGTMPTSGSFKAGRLGRVRLIAKDQVLLGKPLVYDKKTVGRYKF
jgi:ABC-type sugar transport system substrate-binding protein